MTYSLSVMDARYSGLPGQGPASAARDEADGTACGAPSCQLLRIHETMDRFAHADSLAELVSQAPLLLCGAGDFDRAMISRVRGSA